MAERDIEKQPYTPEERRVCDYILRITNNSIGCGDDPVGFLIACHASLASEIKEWREGKRQSGRLYSEDEPARPELKFKMHEVVEAATDIQKNGDHVSAGTRGTIVDLYPGWGFYEVEFDGSLPLTIDEALLTSPQTDSG